MLQTLLCNFQGAFESVWSDVPDDSPLAASGTSPMSRAYGSGKRSLLRQLLHGDGVAESDKAAKAAFACAALARMVAAMSSSADVSAAAGAGQVEPGQLGHVPVCPPPMLTHSTCSPLPRPAPAPAPALLCPALICLCRSR